MANTSFGDWFEKMKQEGNFNQSGDVEAGNTDESSQSLLGGFKLPGFMATGLEKKTDGSPNNSSISSNPAELFKGFANNIRSGNITGATPAAPKNEADQMIMGLSYKTRFKAFVAMLFLSVLFFTLGFVIGLPVIVLRPHKFALSFTLGSLTFMGSFAMLQGPSNHCRAMFRRDRILFTLAYIGSMVMTLYACLVMRSYIFAVGSACVQVSCLLWYFISYLPGGSAGMKYFFRAIYRTAKFMVLPCLKACAASCKMCCKVVNR